jgi:hypothetical protein
MTKQDVDNKFTPLEQRALVQLMDTWNGDFGFTDEMMLDSKRQNGPIIASLNKKGVFDLYPDTVNDKLIVQFVFKDADYIRKVIAVIEGAK